MVLLRKGNSYMNKKNQAKAKKYIRPTSRKIPASRTCKKNYTAGKLQHKGLNRAVRNLKPFDDKAMSRLPLDAYKGTTMFNAAEGCHWLALHDLGRDERNLLATILEEQLAGNKPKIECLSISMRNLVEAINLTQTWQEHLAAQYRDFVTAIKALRADYATNPKPYKYNLIGRNYPPCGEYDEDLSIDLERAWYDAMPILERDRIKFGCITVANHKALDWRWTAAERAVIAADMRYNLVLSHASEALFEILQKVVADYNATEGKHNLNNFRQEAN